MKRYLEPNTTEHLMFIPDDKMSRPVDCLDDDTFSAFVENALSEEETVSVRKHINHCSLCYEQWQDLGIFLVGSEEMPDIHQPISISVKESVLEFLNTVLNGPSRLWQMNRTFSLFGSLTGLAALLVVILFNISSILPTQNRFEEILVSAETEQLHIKDLPLPWRRNNPTLAFDGEAIATEEQIAFGLGLWCASKYWLADAACNPSVDATYYEVGRWYALVWLAASSTNEQLNWDALSTYGQSFVEDFTGNKHITSTTKSRALIQDLQLLIKEVALVNNNQNDAATRERLLQHVTQSLHLFSPSE